jgi:mannose-6-phosphate isomerase-like protein (cupin superfamily)
MIRTGDVIHNSITGESIRFVETAADSDGERVVIDVLVEPSGFVASAHMHPYQTEVFEVVEGELMFEVGGETITATAGTSVTVEPRTAHRFWNASESAVRFRCEVTPALQFEKLLETMFGLANDGKTNKKGLPNPFRLAVIANHHFDDVRLPFPPAWLQKLGLVAGAPVGRLLGYRPDYVPAEAAADVSLAI